MTINSEAVEAAGIAIHNEISDWYPLEGVPDLDAHAKELARKALEAAAPIIRADALHEAAQAVEALRPDMGPGINITQYREGRNDALVRAADVVMRLLWRRP